MAKFYASTYRTQHVLPQRTADGQIAHMGTPEYDEAVVHRGRIQANNACKVGRVTDGERILDVGCRRGLTLQAMREQFQIEAVGIEPGQSDAAVARELGIEVHAGVFETFDPGDRKFDQVQMFHVLEHLHDPVAALTKLRSFLKPTGRIVIEVPDVLQPDGGLKHFFQYPHLYSFSPNTLAGLFHRAGLQPTGMVRQGLLLMVGIPKRYAVATPAPFRPGMLSNVTQNGRWVAQRLRTYEGMEQLKRRLRKGAPFHMAHMQELFDRPALQKHLVQITADLVDILLHRRNAEHVIAVLEAAASGPHDPQFIAMCHGVLGRMGHGRQLAQSFSN